MSEIENKQSEIIEGSPSTDTEISDVEVDENGNVSIHPHTFNDNPHTKRQLVGASVAGAIAGSLACGPFLGIPLGAGTGALLVSSKTKAGEVTRKGGDAVSTAGLKAGDKLRSFEEKHHILDKTKKAANKVTKDIKEQDDKRLHLIDKTKTIANKAKEGSVKGLQWTTKRTKDVKAYDEKHLNLIEKTKKGALKAGEKVKAIEDKHHFVDKTKDAAIFGVRSVQAYDEEHLHLVSKTKDNASKGIEWTKKNTRRVSERLEPNDVPSPRQHLTAVE